MLPQRSAMRVKYAWCRKRPPAKHASSPVQISAPQRMNLFIGLFGKRVPPVPFCGNGCGNGVVVGVFHPCATTIRVGLAPLSRPKLRRIKVVTGPRSFENLSPFATKLFYIFYPEGKHLWKNLFSAILRCRVKLRHRTPLCLSPGMEVVFVGKTLLSPSHTCRGIRPQNGACPSSTRGPDGFQGNLKQLDLSSLICLYCRAKRLFYKTVRSESSGWTDRITGCHVSV